MAYVNQEKKAKIAAELKKVMPKDWKYSLAVRHHSTIVLTIRSAPVDLIAINKYRQINPYHLADHFTGELLETIKKIIAALNIDNHDRSDSMSDYFDVGHYVDVSLGRFDKPFQLAA